MINKPNNIFGEENEDFGEELEERFFQYLEEQPVEEIEFLRECLYASREISDTQFEQTFKRKGRSL